MSGFVVYRLGLYSDLAVGPTFKLCLRTAEASMTVRPVADVAFALCQAFYKGICLLSLLQWCDVNLVLHVLFFNYIVRITIRWIKTSFC